MKNEMTKSAPRANAKSHDNPAVAGVKWQLYDEVAANQTIEAPTGFVARVLLSEVSQNPPGTQYAIAVVSRRFGGKTWPVTFHHDGVTGVLLDLPSTFEWSDDNFAAALNLFESDELPPPPGSVVG